MSCKSILIVEDDEDIRTQVVYALELEGYILHSATNGKKALEILHSLPEEDLPGCIILDLMMPEMDGKTFIETINRDFIQRYGNIKVIVATANGSSSNSVVIPAAVERIQKPFDLDELYRVVEEHCGKVEALTS